MTTPVYLNTLDAQAYKPHLRDLRVAFREACRARWRNEPGADLQILSPEALSCPLSDFQRRRRVWAENQAKEAYKAFYALVDDDCLPVGIERPGKAAIGTRPFLGEAVEILRQHPEFAILSLMPTNARIRPWRPNTLDVPRVGEAGGEGTDVYVGLGVYRVAEDAEVMEHHSVGGIRVCRAGCMKEWPELTRAGYDQEHCEALRGEGYRVGYFRKIKMVHLGEGYSTIW